jgi:hypothetical protein
MGEERRNGGKQDRDGVGEFSWFHNNAGPQPE